MGIFNRSSFSNILIAIGLLLLSFCQETYGKNSLDDHVFLSCETQGSIKSKLRKGYRAFIILPGAPIQNILKDAVNFLNINNEDILTLIFKQQTPDLPDLLKRQQINKYLAIPGNDKLNELDECQKKGKRMFVFAPGNSSLWYSSKAYLSDYTVDPEFPFKVETGFSGNPANDFIIFRMDSHIHALPDSLKSRPDRVPILFNTYSGKLPNFFITDHKDIFLSFKNYCDQNSWYSTNVLYNNDPLCGVSWKEIPELISHGKIHIRHGRISPQKNGFRFSPDVFAFNSLTSEDTKIFYASPMPLLNKMALSLKFNENINNLVGSTNASYSRIEYVKDASRKWCGLFNGKNHFIDFDTGIELENTITICVWVCPTTVTGNHSILGKGEAFSVKYKDGRLLFTTPGIKDHFSDSVVVRENEWQHLAFVFSANKGVRFFKNGVFISEKESADFIPSNHSLLVGTNLWDEYFEGMMDDLAIWNRALSDEEVLRVYTQGLDEDSIPLMKYLLIAGLLLLVVFILAIRFMILSHRKNRSALNLEPTTIKKHIPYIPKEVLKLNNPTIEIFGGFRFINCDNEDLTPRFSTRRKQIFILVMIATFRENGISSKLLTNKIWAGYSAESAKNNRSTQIQRLRDIFSQNSGISIEFKDKKWMISFQEDVFCDLKQYFILLNHIRESGWDNLNVMHLEQLLSIIEKGAVLPQMEDEWLDEFKSKISDELLDLLLPLYQSKELISNHRLAVRLSNALLIFDPLNETVLKHKVNKLFLLDKKTLAHECFEHFSKNYQICYNQPFLTTFADVLNQ
ncbi:MAG: hypothetical protein JEZ14_04625 [Marinilabiliaceae bacterium]|nr:hypothetical protein [Marinilabiliaceae bacterium]